MAKKKETGLGALRLDAEIKQQTKSPSKVKNQSKDNTRKALITRLSPQVHKQLRIMSVEEGTSVQALMEHSIDLLFAEKGKPTSDSLLAD